MGADGSLPIEAQGSVVDVVINLPATTPEDQLGKILEQIKDMRDDDHPSIAVLCRYNWHCEEVADFLRRSSIGVFQRKKQKAPEGWRAAMACVAWMAEPENDELAYSMIKMFLGLEKANAIRKEANASLCSINQVTFEANRFELKNVLEELARGNAPRPIVELVEKAINDLPFGSSVADLSALLQTGYLLEPDGSLCVDTVVIAVRALR